MMRQNPYMREEESLEAFAARRVAEGGETAICRLDLAIIEEAAERAVGAGMDDLRGLRGWARRTRRRYGAGHPVIATLPAGACLKLARAASKNPPLPLEEK